MNRPLSTVVLGLAILTAGLNSRAEVSVDLARGSRVNPIVLAGITEGSDPIGVWRQFRGIAQSQVLNAGGDARGDGPPNLSSLPDGRPLVVWAYNAGPDRDVALSEWTGTEWGPTAYLTVGSEDELDPRIFVEADGTLHVVWWVNDAVDRVMLASRAPGAPQWSLAVQVTSTFESGRRPTVAVANGVLKVAYERDSLQPGAAQDVVVVRREPGGAFTVEAALPTQRTDRLDTVLHVENGQIWFEWAQDSADFGRSECTSGSWNAPSSTPWIGQGWVGVEETRRTVRRQVLGD